VDLQHGYILNTDEVSWRSRGRVLSRLVKLRRNKTFFKRKEFSSSRISFGWNVDE